MHDPISTSFNHYRAKVKCMYVCMNICKLFKDYIKNNLKAFKIPVENWETS